MKHILIPTDFSIQSLNAVHAAVAKAGDAKIKITLFHLLSMSNDISDLLFRSMRNRHQTLVNEDFKEACQVLQNRYSSKLQSLKVDFGFGYTKAYMNNFLAGAKVDSILICDDVQLGQPSPRSVDVLPLLKRLDVPVEMIAGSEIRKRSTGIDVISMLPGNELRVPKPERYVVEK